MDREDIDCIVVPAGGADSAMLQAHARYLTHVGGGGGDHAAVVFPAAGDPWPVVIGVDAWRQLQPWCSDLREASEGFAAAVLARLEEVDLPHRRVGLVGMVNPERPGQATASSGFMHHVMPGLPNVQWLDFTRQLEEIRIVKSPEEIAFIERSTQILDQADDAALGVLRPGVPGSHVWGALVETLCALGSEIPEHVRWVEARRRRTAPPPALGRVEEGGVFLSEAEGAWGGYRARRCQPLACGETDSLFADLMALAIEVWNGGFRRIRPGRSVRTVREEVARLARRFRPRSGPLARATAAATIHGCGLGLDPPMVSAQHASREDLDRIIAPGWCFTFGVTVRAASCSMAWAEAVAVGARAPWRLGNAPQRILMAQVARP
jgi:Xaa-Pro aminopeptidase